MGDAKWSFKAWIKFSPHLVAELKFCGCHCSWTDGRHVDIMPDRRHVRGHHSVQNTLWKIMGSGPNTWSEKVDWMSRQCMQWRNPSSIIPTLNFKISCKVNPMGLRFSYCKTSAPWWTTLVSLALPGLHILPSTGVWANSVIKQQSGFGQSERL